MKKMDFVGYRQDSKRCNHFNHGKIFHSCDVKFDESGKRMRVVAVF